MAKKPTTAEKRRLYSEFAALPGSQFCWACGWHYPRYYEATGYPRLEIAHIVGGAGRRHDRRAIVMLCNGCHRAAHNERVRASRASCDLLPALTLANMLWLKQQHDPECYDPKYLQSLRTAHAEELYSERPPEWYSQRMQAQHRPAWQRTYGRELQP